MTIGWVKSLPHIWGKTPPVGVLPLDIFYSYFKKIIFNCTKVIAIIVRNLKFDADAYYIK